MHCSPDDIRVGSLTGKGSATLMSAPVESFTLSVQGSMNVLSPEQPSQLAMSCA